MFTIHPYPPDVDPQPFYILLAGKLLSSFHLKGPTGLCCLQTQNLDPFSVCSKVKQYHRRVVLLSSFHLSGHTFRFRLTTAVNTVQ